MGAALAYYTVFSLGPLLLIVISIAGLVFGQEAARGEIVGQLAGLMGADAAKAIEDLLASVNKPAQGIASAALGVGLLLVGATTVFGELQDALDRIWRAGARARRGGGACCGPGCCRWHDPRIAFLWMVSLGWRRIRRSASGGALFRLLGRLRRSSTCWSASCSRQACSR